MTETFDEQYFTKLLDDYKKSKEFIDNYEKRHNAMKAELSDAIIKFGFEDDKGHLWLKVGDAEIKRERRVSRTFDMASAEQWAKDNDLWDRVKVVVEQLDEDALLALAWENEDIAEIVTGFYGEKETWAFKA